MSITVAQYREMYGIAEDTCIDCRQQPSIADAARCGECQEWLVEVTAVQAEARATIAASVPVKQTTTVDDLVRGSLGAHEVPDTAQGDGWSADAEDGDDIIAATAAKGFDDNACDAEMTGAIDRLVLLLDAIHKNVDSDGIVSVNDIRGSYSHFTRRQMRQLSGWYRTILVTSGLLKRIKREESTDTVGRNTHHPASVFFVNRVVLEAARANPRAFVLSNQPTKRRTKKAPTGPIAAPAVAPVEVPVVEHEQVSLW